MTVDGAMRLRVTRLGAQGDGIAALPDGAGPAFLPMTLPGEVVEAEPGPGRAAGRPALRRVIEPSPERVAPPCPHFGACGGCALQHWAAAPMAAWKRGLLAEALARAGFPGAPVGETRTSPPATRRRADLALRRAHGGAVTLGFHAKGAAEVVDLAACAVLDPRLVGLFAPLREVLRRLPALRREGSAVLNLLDTGPDLLLRTDGPLDAAGRVLLAGFAAAQGIPRIAWAPTGEKGAEAAAETAAQLGPVSIALSGVPVAPAPAAFLQATPAGEAAIAAAVLDALPSRLPPRAAVAELFAGLGTLTFAMAAARPGLRIDAFEGAAEAVAALSAAAGRAGLGRVRGLRRDLARQPLLAKELAAYAAVVLDPPYAGAAEQVGLIARARVPQLAYVSCNPAALARDAALLARAGYRVRSATPVDQFLWSPHLESVIGFSL